MRDFFTDADPGVSCADCGLPHEWVRPGKTQPTCDCAFICREHKTPLTYRGEDHPANVTAKAAGVGMSLGYHCDACEAEWDAKVSQIAYQPRG